MSKANSNREPSHQFKSLKASLIRQGRLYEDPEFAAGPIALANNDIMFEWRRPSEISKNPVFVMNGMEKSDLYQGALKNCWVIAGAACMASAHTQLLERCIPTHQSFQQGYAGVFCFNFWRFGKWVEVIIDDRLPTVQGRLVFGSNKTQVNEFWVPLFEKAYAKLYKGYYNLEGGFTTNALVDFTGGISEMIDLKEKVKEKAVFYEELYHMMQKSSMFGAHISGNSISESPLTNGLYSGHAYSIINFVVFHYRGKEVNLLQLRNPWGKKEWKGPWSDGSQEWSNVPEEFRKKMSLIIKDDGDFWMAFDDFIHNFDYLTICHLDPDGAEATGSKEKKVWKTQSFYDQWIKGFNAGGGGNSPHEKLFWKNPQFSVTVDAASPQSTMVISLMQASITQDDNAQINFRVYKLKENADTVILNPTNTWSLSEKIKHDHSIFMNMREVADHITVTAGKYVIIPSSFQINVSRKFLLRVYTESDTQSQTIDIPTHLKTPFDPVDHEYDEAFKAASRGSVNVDPKEMMAACNQVLNEDGLFWTIGLETARNLLAMLDKEHTGLISLVEFRKIMKEVLQWKEKFKTFDRDLSGDIDTFELNQIFKSIGFNISRQVLETIFRRYGGKNCRLSFEDFVHACSKLISLYGVFVKKRENSTPPKLTLPLEEWLSTTIYL